MTEMHIEARVLEVFCQAYLQFVMAGEKFRTCISSQTKHGQGYLVTNGFKRTTATYTITQYTEQKFWSENDSTGSGINQVDSYILVENRYGIVFYAVQTDRKGRYQVYAYPQKRVLQKILDQIVDVRRTVRRDSSQFTTA